jgi:hypothetical protein
LLIVGIPEHRIRFCGQESAALGGRWGLHHRSSLGAKESAMPQIPSFADFDPEIAATLGAAYDEAVARLLNQPDIVRETVAKRIVALAAKGERDAHALCDQALIVEGFLS